MRGGCVPLRRSFVAVVMANPFNVGSPVLAVMFIVHGLSDPVWLFFAVPFVVLFGAPLLRPLRVCGDALVKPGVIVREFRQPLSELVAIEVGTFRWSGLSGYRGWAVVLHLADEQWLMYHSRYCGKQRLLAWVRAIEAMDAFKGEVRTSDRSELWEGLFVF